jgi:predicted nuclease of predicted toxin-antitoxin system
MRLLVDEDTQSRRQLSELRNAGHDVLSVGESGNNGLSDADVLALAQEEGRALLTQNCADFLALANQGVPHPGILAIYNDADASKNMSHRQVAEAVTKLEGSGTPIPNEFHVLNNWR